MSYNLWCDSTLHRDHEQQNRQKSACNNQLTPLSIDQDNELGYFKNYKTSLESCTCRDFILRKLPCKHMYRLAYELKVFQLPFKVESTETVIFSTGNTDKYLDKSTGEIISRLSKNGAIDQLNLLSAASLKELKTALYNFSYRKTNQYFSFNKRVIEELKTSLIVTPLDLEVEARLAYADRQTLLKLIELIGSTKTVNLNPRATTKTILKFINTQLSLEISQLADTTCVFVPNPDLQDSYISIYRAIFKKFTETNLCYDCYLKHNSLEALDPDTYFFTGDVFCTTCDNMCDGLIRVFKD